MLLTVVPPLTHPPPSPFLRFLLCVTCSMAVLLLPKPLEEVGYLPAGFLLLDIYVRMVDAHSMESSVGSASLPPRQGFAV